MAMAGMRRRDAVPLAPAAVAIALAAVSLTCAVGAVVLHHYLVARVPVPVQLPLADVVLATAFPVVGATVLLHQRSNRVGWLLLSSAFMGPYLLAGQYAALSLLSPHPGTAAATWLSVWGYVPYFVIWGLVPMHFPDGFLPSPRWRIARGFTVGLIVVETGARAFAPIDSDVSATLRNPIGIDSAGWLNIITLVTSLLIIFGAGLCGVAAVWIRLRQAVGVERARMQWLVAGVTWLLAATLVGAAIGGTGPTAGQWQGIGMLGFVVALAAGAVRHQLFDVGVALSRTIVYTGLTGFLLLAYVAAVAGAGALAPGRRAALAVIAVAALLAAAARDQFQRVVDRLLFGHRRDPYAVLSQVRGRLDLATGPIDALAQLAEGLRSALRLPYVAVESTDARLPAIRAGTSVGSVERLDARDRGDDLGVLIIGHRRPGERFSSAERRALGEVAGQVGELLRSAGLFHDLQHSRERLVLAREEERRRLRRDLHDGLGPQLAAVAMQLERLVDRLPPDDALRARGRQTTDQLRDTVVTVRHIVEDLRPPALDDLGLLGALAQLVEPYAPVASLHAPATMPALPAATESAAFRIVGEALTNAMRHSGGTRCDVRMAVRAPWLIVEVCDDGAGIADGAVPGVGLESIRDRASEVGGRLEVTGGSGTTVRARLPLAAHT